MNPRRQEVSTRRLAATIGVTLAGLPVVLAARAVLMHPALFVWAVFAGVFCWAVTATVHWFTWAGRGLEAETERLWLEAENAHLHLKLTEAEQHITPVPLVRPTGAPGLHVVKQREPEHDALPVADESWLGEITDGRWTS